MRMRMRASKPYSLLSMERVRCDPPERLYQADGYPVQDDAWPAAHVQGTTVSRLC
jgi:hypothetical protein